MEDHQANIIDLRNGMFQIEIVEGGLGSPLVYIHGASGFMGWTQFLDQLSQSFNVIAPAHPGVSQSTGLQFLDNMWDLVLFYEELFNELGLKTFQLFGDGYGAMIAAELAAHRPDMISSLALIAPLGIWLDDTPTLDIYSLTPTQRIQKEWFDPDDERAKELFGQPAGETDKLNFELQRTQTAQSVSKFMWPIADHGLIKRIHRVSMPTLLVWGDSDQVVPFSYAEAFQDLLSDVALEVIPNCGHLPQYERPVDCLEILTRFFSNSKFDS